DLGRFDAVPADLGLVVLAAAELDVPAGAVPARAAGGLGAFARAGPGHEPLGGAVLVAEVAHGHAGAADVELAGDPVGAVAHLHVQHVEGLVGEGAAVGDAGPVRGLRADGVVDGPDGALGCAAEAVQVGSGQVGADPLGQGDGDPVPGEQGGAQRVRCRLRVGCQV